VHDPESPGGKQGVPASLGDLAGLRAQGRACAMLDGGPFNADKAYKDSKVCNVLFTRELQRRLDAAGSQASVNCFNPGLIVSTGFFRDQNPLFTKLFDVAATRVFRVAESPAWGGAALVYTAAQDTRGLYYSAPPGAVRYGDAAFGREFTPEGVGREAGDDALARDLWELSEKALGL
jgi:protochlorophyllide reductase